MLLDMKRCDRKQRVFSGYIVTAHFHVSSETPKMKMSQNRFDVSGRINHYGKYLILSESDIILITLEDK